MKKRQIQQGRRSKLLALTFISATALLIGAGSAFASNPAPPKSEYMTPTFDSMITYTRPAEVPQGKGNAATPERIELGKHLFFDPRLSGSNFISCATCHNPALGWSDGQPTAIGHGMQVLRRATPTIINTAYQKFQFWDGRATTLEEQALGPIVAAGEMNQPLDELVIELKAIPGYVKMFDAAYPEDGISASSIGKAIALFERTVVSSESNFDRWLMGDEKALTEEEAWGFVVFEGKGNCDACHSGFNFADDKFHNIGLKGVTNEGRFAIEPKASLKGAFKTPTLRDIALTGPYMHNGAYDTLEEVVEHYDTGGFKNSGEISKDLKSSLELSDHDKKALVAFMKALTGNQVKITVPQLPAR
ncbi:MAG: tryptophan tryptophylquinone biosynthesis enzyme MauG [Gammaproteobacteria bacterium]|nr:tryptophan tryptophylquinone biosynthesis enzyme MauG [Gammaproteobacteria bacterium]